MLKNMQLKRKKKHYSTVKKDESAPDLLIFSIQKIFLRKKKQKDKWVQYVSIHVLYKRIHILADAPTISGNIHQTGTDKQIGN